MASVKVTVVKKMTNKDLIDRYGKDVKPQCELFNVGAEFISRDLGMPEGFCSWAWADIQRDVAVLALGGDFSWTREKGIGITSCTDGLRPVIFKLQRVEE